MSPQLGPNQQELRALVWFRGMAPYTQYHVDSCALCLARRTTEEPVGIAVRCKRRLQMLQFDHKKLTDAQAAATQHAAILTAVDPVP